MLVELVDTILKIIDAALVELVDTPDSKSCEGNLVTVQARRAAPPIFNL
jgi:hypothetical protein